MITKPLIFEITEQEITDITEEMFGNKIKLNKNQIAKILACVAGDEFLAKDISDSIRASITEILQIN